jgi:hypothetical protein
MMQLSLGIEIPEHIVTQLVTVELCELVDQLFS